MRRLTQVKREAVKREAKEEHEETLIPIVLHFSRLKRAEG
jgi:hypothetical protein